MEIARECWGFGRRRRFGRARRLAAISEGSLACGHWCPHDLLPFYGASEGEMRSASQAAICSWSQSPAAIASIASSASSIDGGAFHTPTIDFQEHAQRDPCSPLVAISERMVLREPNDEDRRLRDEVRKEELDVAEPGSRRVQCRVREVETRGAHQGGGIDAGHLCGYRDIVDQVDVVDVHFASRSSSSVLVDDPPHPGLNAGSLRRRSTASLSACLTVSFRLKPSARARASVSAASSSPRRTVRFLAMVSWQHRTGSGRLPPLLLHARATRSRWATGRWGSGGFFDDQAVGRVAAFRSIEGRGSDSASDPRPSGPLALDDRRGLAELHGAGAVNQL